MPNYNGISYLCSQLTEANVAYKNNDPIKMVDSVSVFAFVVALLAKLKPIDGVFSRAADTKL